MVSIRWPVDEEEEGVAVASVSHSVANSVEPIEELRTTVGWRDVNSSVSHSVTNPVEPPIVVVPTSDEPIEKKVGGELCS